MAKEQRQLELMEQEIKKASEAEAKAQRAYERAMKEKEKVRKTNANRVSGGVATPSPKDDTRASIKFSGGVGLKANDRSSLRTLKEVGASEKHVKTPANSNKLFDNSTAAGISQIGDLTAKSSNKANSNSPLETSDKMMECSISGVLMTNPDRSTMIPM